MSDFLFDVPEQKSPRLLWLERHNIETRQTGTSSDELGDCMRWIAENPVGIGYGETKNEAVTKLALKLGIKFWFEEGGQS